MDRRSVLAALLAVPTLLAAPTSEAQSIMFNDMSEYAKVLTVPDNYTTPVVKLKWDKQKLRGTRYSRKLLSIEIDDKKYSLLNYESNRLTIQNRHQQAFYEAIVELARSVNYVKSKLKHKAMLGFEWFDNRLLLGHAAGRNRQMYIVYGDFGAAQPGGEATLEKIMNKLL